MLFVRELRNAARRLLARPGYAALSVAVLGVGLGTVVFLFSLINGLVLQPLPFAHAGQLVSIDYGNDLAMTGQDFKALRQRLHRPARIGGFSQDMLTLGSGGAQQTLFASRVSASLFELLGVKPAIGRGFTRADEQPGEALHVLVGHRLWRQRFHGDRDIVGRSVTVGGRQATIIGVMPKGFAFPYLEQLWLPVRITSGADLWLKGVARLRPGVSLASGRAELAAATRGRGRQLQGQRAGHRLHMEPLSHLFVPVVVRNRVWMMFGAGLLVLLLACTNVASLQVVQAMNRRREMALRSALGASRGLLLLPALAESLILSLLATGLALYLAHLGNRWFNGLLQSAVINEPYYMHFDISSHLLVFAALAALLATGLAGMLPALHASRTDAQSALRDGAKGSRGGSFARMTGILVIAEVALTVVLLVGAGMFVRALSSIRPTHDNGVVDPSHVLVEWVGMPGRHWANGQDRLRFLDDVVRRLRNRPGVIDAAAGEPVPDASGYTMLVAAEGRPRPAGGYTRAQVGAVDTHFAATYRVHLAEGRFFDAADRDARRAVAVIDQDMARRLWPGGDALGQHVVIDPASDHPGRATVIGVTAPLRLGRTIDPPRPALMLPTWLSPPRSVHLAVRMRGDPLRFVHRLNQTIRRTASATPLFDARTQAGAIVLGQFGVGVFTEVFSVIGAVTLLLAAAGLYGFLAFSVAQRTRDIGIRRAIGAGGPAIVGHVARQLSVQLGVGLGVGLLLALPWSQLLADPELHTHGHDPLTFAAVTMLVVSVAVLATLVPLLRALRVDPAVALRYE